MATLKHRTTAGVRLEGTSGGQEVQTPYSRRASQRQIPCTMSTWLLVTQHHVHLAFGYLAPWPFGFWIPPRTTSSLSNLQYFIIPTGQKKKSFLQFRGNLLCLNLCSLPSHQWEPLKRAWLSLLTLSFQEFTCFDIFKPFFFLQ